ncbi:hypothetical protein IJF93_01940 [Candidatus Saccharibacteria bacterium]|nr:hypothetical protein [Candidatus Saccharibacteria bacterium]
MVCIAAFIILAIIGVFVAVISIFKPKVGKAYLKAFKKAWGCLWKKVRLQKCETGFKDDIKNTLLSRVIIKHPKWLKPLSILIEVLSVLIVIIAVWAILTAIKSLLALWALGSCNVTKPSACSLGAEVCSIDETEPTNVFEATGRWFTEWGEIFEAIPDKFRSYNAEDYDFNYISVISAENGGNVSDKIAVDIFDPGCSVCMVSYRNQKAAGFFEQYNVRLVPFAIQDANDEYKFKNSEIIVRYMFAAEQFESGLALGLIDHVFTDRDSEGVSYQNKFNEDYSREEAIDKLEQWLSEAGVDKDGIKEIRNIVDYPEITDKMNENRNIVENELKVKGIPTMIYDGARHTGLWKSE